MSDRRVRFYRILASVVCVLSVILIAVPFLILFAFASADISADPPVTYGFIVFFGPIWSRFGRLISLVLLGVAAVMFVRDVAHGKLRVLFGWAFLLSGVAVVSAFLPSLLFH